MIWRDCKKKLPRKRSYDIFLSEVVLIYNGKNHSIAFYDYGRNEWKDITTNAYISDMKGKWAYLPRPRKKLKIRLELE